MLIPTVEFQFTNLVFKSVFQCGCVLVGSDTDYVICCRKKAQVTSSLWSIHLNIQVLKVTQA